MTSTEQTSATTTKTGRKIGRRVGGLVLAGMLALVGLGVGAQPAAAATTVTACFRWDSGAAYANQPVHLMRWNGRSWASERSGRTGSNGCGTFYNTPSNVHLTVKAYVAYGNKDMGMALYEGWAPRYTNLGGGGANVGTGYVSLVQCTYGLYGYCAGMR